MQKIFQLTIIFTIGLWTGGILPSHQSVGGPQATFASAPVGDEVPADPSEKAGITDFDPATYVWQLVLFFALFAVLALVVWPQILKGLKAREEKQRGDLTAAENASKEATATLEQYKQQLADARKEAQQIIEQSKTDAQHVAAQLKDQSAAELNQMRDRAQAEIRSAQEQAITAIYEETATLATRIAGQILKRELDPAAHQALVNESIQQMSANRN